MREKPSDRLQFALDTLIEAEQPDAPVKPDMGVYHDINDGICFACLGGLASIRKYKLNPRKGDGNSYDIIPASKESTIRGYEFSLDAFRVGEVEQAFHFMRLNQNDGTPFNRQMPNYHSQPTAFKDAIRQLIVDLKAEGY